MYLEKKRIGTMSFDIIDFLKLHYVLSERTDSDYWREHSESGTIPESLRDSLDLWRSHVPWVSDGNNRIQHDRPQTLTCAHVFFFFGGPQACIQVKTSENIY